MCIDEILCLQYISCTIRAIVLKRYLGLHPRKWRVRQDCHRFHLSDSDEPHCLLVGWVIPPTKQAKNTVTREITTNPYWRWDVELWETTGHLPGHVQGDGGMTSWHWLTPNVLTLLTTRGSWCQPPLPQMTDSAETHWWSLTVWHVASPSVEAQVCKLYWQGSKVDLLT